MVISERKR